MASKTAQKTLTTQFMSITGVNEKQALKSLKASNWKLEQAMDSYFALIGGAPIVNNTSDALGKLFEKYRASTDEKDETAVDGTMQYLTDLGLNLENAEMFVALEIVQAPAFGELSKNAFVEGWKAIGADTVPKQRAYVATQIKQLSKDMTLFKRVYKHAFICAKEKGQKAMSLDNAMVYWGVLFASPGKPWVTASTDFLSLWLEFLEAKWTKSVNKDMWNQTFEFYKKSLEDESLSFWSEDGAWPGVIDEFVGYVKEKRGDVPETETMETD